VSAKHEPPNKPMKLTVAFGARSLSAGRSNVGTATEGRSQGMPVGLTGV
jgi:hypothetical protein